MMFLNKVSIPKIAKSAFALSQNSLPCGSSMATVIAPAMQKRTKVTLPDLPYDYSALEPVISAEIMQLHHSKHHQTYVNNYNVAEEKLADAVSKGDASTVIGLAGALKFNGGGHINHSIFWQNLCPVSESGEPSSELL